LVLSPFWDNGAIVDAGAITLQDGNAASSGLVAATNSMIGNAINDQLGNPQPVLLSNGNYVVPCSRCDINGITDTGAVRWMDGNAPTTGTLNAANSLFGTHANDWVGGEVSAVVALSNGNYVVRSPYWDNGAVSDVGAVTFGNGSSGTVGAVSGGNSLIGSRTNDLVGNAVTTLSQGNYAVSSRYWDNGAETNAGAVTWGNGNSGVVGAVSPNNSFVGVSSGDSIGAFGDVRALQSGELMIQSPYWSASATLRYVGAVSLFDGGAAVIGTVNASNSVLGMADNRGFTQTVVEDAPRQRILIGRPFDNDVIIFDGKWFAHGFE
jgi:Repeat of unknown function (DUF5650)